MARRVVLLPGDGIGPEVTAAARRVLDATGVALDWDVQEADASAVAAIREAEVALKGPLTTPRDGSQPSMNLALRRELDLFAQVRRCRSADGSVDVLVARETTEDLYAGVEFAVSADAAFAMKPVTAAAVQRAAAAVRAYATAEGRQRITIVHKASAIPVADGLFLRAAGEALAGCEVDDLLVDLAAAECVKNPGRFDVVFTGNLYGDILADLLGAVVGSVGLVAGVNLGDDVAVFEPTHGSAPRHAGQDRVNPTGAILSGAMLLRHIGEGAAADRVEQAVERVLTRGEQVTYDVAPPGAEPVSTTAMADAVIAAL
jgi:isocitrate dehydrogenase (NAD+)